MKEKILKLREEGKTYKEISEALHIGIERVEWHCNPNRKNVSRNGNRNYRRKNPLYKKVASFHGITKTKVPSFSYKEFLERVGEHPKCYVTNTPIDLNDIASYSIDHIIPNSRGGTNAIDNASLIRSDINRMKRDKTVDEFLALCVEVLTANGYEVRKSS